ncbi:hypothetical protein, partial [Nonomuraea sp. NPDC049725]|uniref:hypothetical protein n=1 Tax=Nonomuraea sp. NPDC049725 TaxID=3154508 RepID=UPI003427C265
MISFSDVISPPAAPVELARAVGRTVLTATLGRAVPVAAGLPVPVTLGRAVPVAAGLVAPVVVGLLALVAARRGVVAVSTVRPTARASSTGAAGGEITSLKLIIH